MRRANKFEKNIKMKRVKKYARLNRYLVIAKKLRARKLKARSRLNKYLIKKKSKD